MEQINGDEAMPPWARLLMQSLGQRIEESKEEIIRSLRQEIKETNDRVESLEVQSTQATLDLRESVTALEHDMQAVKAQSEDFVEMGRRIESLKTDVVQEVVAQMEEKISEKVGKEIRRVQEESRSGGSEELSDESESLPSEFAAVTAPDAEIRGPAIKADIGSKDELRRRGSSNFRIHGRLMDTPADKKGKAKSGGAQPPSLVIPGEPPPGGRSRKVGVSEPGMSQPASEKVASVNVNVLLIDEHHKLKEISLRALMKLLYEVYALYLRTSVDRSFSLVDHISREVLEDLVADQRMKDFPCGVRVAMTNIYDIGADEIVKSMLYECVRPGSRDVFERMLYSAVSKLPAHVEGQNFTADYDRRLARKVDKILHEVLVYVGMMLNGASEEQRSVLPKMNWGKSETARGVIQMAMQCLRPYVGNFKAMIESCALETGGLEALTSCTSLQGWVSIIEKVNDKYSGMAIQMRLMELQSRPQEKADLIQDRVEVARMQKSFISGKVEKQALEDRRKDGAAADLGRVEEWFLNENGEYKPYLEVQGIRQPTIDVRARTELRPYGRVDERANIRAPQQVSNPQHGGGRGGKDEQFGLRGRGKGGESAFQGRPGPGQVLGRGSGVRKPIIEFGGEPYLCFKYAMGKCDQGEDCEYTHDPVLAGEYLAKKVAYYTSSRWYDPRIKGDRVQAPQNFKIAETEWYDTQRAEHEEQKRLEAEYTVEDDDDLPIFDPWAAKEGI